MHILRKKLRFVHFFSEYTRIAPSKSVNIIYIRTCIFHLRNAMQTSSTARVRNCARVPYSILIKVCIKVLIKWWSNIRVFVGSFWVFYFSFFPLQMEFQFPFHFLRKSYKEKRQYMGREQSNYNYNIKQQVKS